MATETKAMKKENEQRARELFNAYAPYIQDDSALLIISQEFGKGLTDYLRVQLAYTDENGKTQTAYFTWAVGKAFGYPLKDRNGYAYLAISGYGYSKADEIARNLAFIYGVDRIRYEMN